jgi:hypothetical protein
MHETNLTWDYLEHATKKIEIKEGQLFNINIIDSKEEPAKQL